jgi:hypothetical protein
VLKNVFVKSFKSKKKIANGREFNLTINRNNNYDDDDDRMSLSLVWRMKKGMRKKDVMKWS